MSLSLVKRATRREREEMTLFLNCGTSVQRRHNHGAFIPRDNIPFTQMRYSIKAGKHAKSTRVSSVQTSDRIKRVTAVVCVKSYKAQPTCARYRQNDDTLRRQHCVFRCGHTMQHCTANCTVCPPSGIVARNIVRNAAKVEAS